MSPLPEDEMTKLSGYCFTLTPANEKIRFTSFKHYLAASMCLPSVGSHSNCPHYNCIGTDPLPHLWWMQPRVATNSMLALHRLDTYSASEAGRQVLQSAVVKSEVLEQLP